MKQALITLLVGGLLTLTNCSAKETDKHPVSVGNSNPGDSTKAPKLTEIIEPEYRDTVLLQDINNDGTGDTAFVVTPPTLAYMDEQGSIHSEFGCVDGDCYNSITFSCEAPELVFENSVWGTIENAGDLNGDGMNELIFCPNWFIGNCTQLHLYTLKSGKWEEIASVDYRRNDDAYSLKSHLVKQQDRYYMKGIVIGEDTPYKQEVKF